MASGTSLLATNPLSPVGCDVGPTWIRLTHPLGCLIGFGSGEFGDQVELFFYVHWAVCEHFFPV